MAISPFEERYRTEMNAIFDEEAKLRKWMAVEVALAKAHAKLGDIPKDAPAKIEAACQEGHRSSGCPEIEAEIHHDLMAMVKALTEQAGDAGKYVHLGATSYDIEDTATGLIFIEAIDLIEKRMLRLGKVLKKLALDHKETVCIGRTHGQHAVPTTYGMKFALYYQELQRDMESVRDAQEAHRRGQDVRSRRDHGDFRQRRPEDTIPGHEGAGPPACRGHEPGHPARPPCGSAVRARPH